MQPFTGLVLLYTHSIVLLGVAMQNTRGTLYTGRDTKILHLLCGMLGSGDLLYFQSKYPEHAKSKQVQ